jgi:hypothetical protein
LIGKGVERNPVMAWLFKMLPKQLWWLTKMPFIPAVLGLWFIDWPYGTIGVWLCCVFCAAVVYNNYCIINALSPHGGVHRADHAGKDND